MESPLIVMLGLAVRTALGLADELLSAMLAEKVISLSVTFGT
jgi:hypothetical protein